MRLPSEESYVLRSRLTNPCLTTPFTARSAHPWGAYVLHPPSRVPLLRHIRSLTSVYLHHMGTTLDWYRAGGPTMLLITIVGASGLAILVERVYVIVVRSKNNGRAFIERIIQLVRGGKIDDAIKQCASSTASLPDMGLLILRSRSRDEGDLQQLAHAAALSVLPKLTRRLQYLVPLAVIAILLGVMGTLLGARTALLTETGAAADHAATSARLGAALTPTIFSLAVAAVLVLGRAYLMSQSE